MSDVGLPLPASVLITPGKLLLVIFAIFVFFAAVNLSFVGSKAEERCDTQPGPFSNSFNTGFQMNSCVCNHYFSFAEACPTPTTLLALDFAAGI